MKILIADDSRVMRQIVIRTLRQAGYDDNEIVEAEDGRDALDKVGSEKPDLVLSDWNMPNMTGIELLKNIRAEPSIKDMPVLMITAEARKENIIEAAQNGANGYIVKPFTAATLDEKLTKIFKALEAKKAA